MAQVNVDTCTLWAEQADMPSPCDDYQTDQNLADDMLQAASNILYRLTARRWPGVCADTVRPCVRRIYEEWGADQRRRIEGRWPWRLWPACGCQTGRRCGHTTLDEITLGGEPVISVTEVRIDGSVLSSDAYRIDDNRWLVRIDGQDWPTSQDLAADPATDDDTFQVEFTYGADPPVDGKHAAAVLACELYKAAQPEDLGECRLPRRLQSLTRQGVDMVVSDTMEFVGEGRTGLPEVDFFIQSANPHQLRRNATVLTPDIGRRVRRADT